MEIGGAHLFAADKRTRLAQFFPTPYFHALTTQEGGWFFEPNQKKVKKACYYAFNKSMSVALHLGINGKLENV